MFKRINTFQMWTYFFPRNSRVYTNFRNHMFLYLNYANTFQRKYIPYLPGIVDLLYIQHMKYTFNIHFLTATDQKCK